MLHRHPAEQQKVRARTAIRFRLAICRRLAVRPAAVVSVPLVARVAPATGRVACCARRVRARRRANVLVDGLAPKALVARVSCSTAVPAEVHASLNVVQVLERRRVAHGLQGIVVVEVPWWHVRVQAQRQA